MTTMAECMNGGTLTSASSMANLSTALHGAELLPPVGGMLGFDAIIYAQQLYAGQHLYYPAAGSLLSAVDLVSDRPGGPIPRRPAQTAPIQPAICHPTLALPPIEFAILIMLIILLMYWVRCFLHVRGNALGRFIAYRRKVFTRG